MTSLMNSIVRNLQGSVRNIIPGAARSDYDDEDDLMDEDGSVRVGLGCGATAPPPLLQMSRQDCISPCSVKFFWGRIPRETAVQALAAKGLKQGLFLLREKTDHQRNFALSVVHKERVHHYIVERCSNGSVRVPKGRSFPGPVELIQHHQRHQDGFLCRLTTPCERPVGESPLVFKNFTVKDLEEAVSREATRLNLSGAALLKNLGPQRAAFENRVVRRLHEEMPWYHHTISRQEAEDRISVSGHVDGLFLVRISFADGTGSSTKRSAALTISFDGGCRHYRVSADTRDRVSIEKSSKFNSIMELIDHYYYNQDGLLHQLTLPCLAPGCKPPASKRLSTTFSPAFNAAAASNHSPSSSDPPTPLPRRQPQALPPPPTSSCQTPPPTPPQPTFESSPPTPGLTSQIRRHRPLTPPRDETSVLLSQAPPPPPPRPQSMRAPQPTEPEPDLCLQDIWDEPPDDLPPALIGVGGAANAAFVGDDSGANFDPETYGRVPKELFKLDRREIILQNPIGTGNFGAVLKGVWIHEMENIPVAVKSLKSPEGGSTDQEEILKEAETMKMLDHESIIKMLGVCVDGDPLMLVLEFAPLGPLHKFLRRNKDFPVADILPLMLQVSKGMAYLESLNLVHRDLAARNILLVNQCVAKISDFGLSKAIGQEQDYYRAVTAGRWPLKWYAPEAIYFWKFDTRTDVWSFGVTLWEAMSYGAAPYKGKKGEEIISLIEAGRRLEQPVTCPDAVFAVMLKCWTYSPKARPSFKEVVTMMEELTAGLERRGLRGATGGRWFR